MTVEDDISLEVLARRRLALVEQAESIAAAIAAIDAQFIDRLQAGDTLTIDDTPVWRVQQKRTFDMGLAQKVLPEQVLAAATVTTTQIDQKVLRALLPPALEAQCMKPGKVFVSKAGRS